MGELRAYLGEVRQADMFTLYSVRSFSSSFFFFFTCLSLYSFHPLSRSGRSPGLCLPDFLFGAMITAAAYNFQTKIRKLKEGHNE